MTFNMSRVISTKDKPRHRQSKDSVTLLPCFYFVELPLVVSAAVSLYFLELTDVFQPVQAGFRCRDRSLSMPYLDPSDELLPFLMLLSLAFAGPALSILLMEGLLYCVLIKRGSEHLLEPNINAGGCNFNSFLRRSVRFIGMHAFGLCVTALMTDVVQLATGYQAPYFLTVCRPNYTLLAAGGCEEGAFVTRDVCTGTDRRSISHARRSFPCQHASVGAFAAVYISMYLNTVLTDSTKLLKAVLVLAFMLCAGISGLAQTVQYRSHPADIYTGFLLGAAVALYLGRFVVDNFKPRSAIGGPAAGRGDGGPASKPFLDLAHEPLARAGEGLPGARRERELDLPRQQPEGALTRGIAGGAGGAGPQEQGGGGGVSSGSVGGASAPSHFKRASLDIQTINPDALPGGAELLTFASNTLPRAGVGPAPEDFSVVADGGGGGGGGHRHHHHRHHLPAIVSVGGGGGTGGGGGGSATVYATSSDAANASLDSMRSRQLLAQWRSAQRHSSLQSADSTSRQSLQRQLSADRRSNGELGSGVCINVGDQRYPISTPVYAGNAGAGVSQQQQQQQQPQTCNGGSAVNGSAGGNGYADQGIAAGAARVAVQSRPGSSQLVHIPEEMAHDGPAAPPPPAPSVAASPKAAGGGGGARVRVNVSDAYGSLRQHGAARTFQRQRGGATADASSSSSGSEASGGRGRSPADAGRGHPVVRVSPGTAAAGDGGGGGGAPRKWGALASAEPRQSFEMNDLGGRRGERGRGAGGDGERPPLVTPLQRAATLSAVNLNGAAGGQCDASDAWAAAVAGSASRDSTLRRKASVPASVVPGQGRCLTPDGLTPHELFTSRRHHTVHVSSLMGSTQADV
uniref:Phospholipid phosphatase-related protein type 4-like n=1 Tax=Petromyzon marinus TaxID=7757 RepID=A0AAJ7TYM7_PETMA|nr:phospholipid phosphatase-related protein type 4-like [Petromyzon marinus]